MPPAVLLGMRLRFVDEELDEETGDSELRRLLFWLPPPPPPLLLPPTSGPIFLMFGMLLGSSGSVLLTSSSFQRFFRPSIFEERKPCILLFEPFEYWLYLAFS